MLGLWVDPLLLLICACTVLFERPVRKLHEILVRMVRKLLDPRKRQGIPKVRSDDHGVALHAQKSSSPKRCISIYLVEIVLIQAQPVGAVGFFLDSKRFVFFWNFCVHMLIPWANHLAYVATEYPRPQGGSHGLRDSTAVLDGPVADTSIRIEDIGRDKGSGRTCV